MPKPIERPGYEELWEWFGLSYAGFCVLPRAFMHEMPDEWQRDMARLLREWDAHWDWSELGFDTTSVSAKNGNKFVKMPKFVTEYRRPHLKAIKSFKTDGS